jgi:hypothetical protein
MIGYFYMGKRRYVRRGEKPGYPTDEEAKTYATLHKEQALDHMPCRTAYMRHEHSQSIDVLTTWGCNNIYFVFAFPAAGFDIASPEEVLNLEYFKGFIVEHKPQPDVWNVLVNTERDGVEFFWQEHARHQRS